MKPRLSIRMFFVGLLLSGLGVPLSAQNFKLEFKYAYGNNKDEFRGDIKYDVAFTRSGSPGITPLKAKDNGKIDMRSAEYGQLVFTFHIRKLDWDKNSHRKSHTLYVRPRCTPPPSGLKAANNDDIEIKYGSVNETVTLVYNIEDNCTGELRIGISASDNIDSVGCDNYLRFPLVITGVVVNPAKKDCDAALAAFKANKTGSIGQVKAVKFQYPDAPCMKELDNIIAQYDHWDKARMAPNCDEAKKLCKTYLDTYGNEGLFSSEINTINNNSQHCKTTPKPEPKPDHKPTAATKEKSEEEKAFARIRSSTNKDSISAFIDFWSDKSPGSAFVQQARALLAGLLPIEYEEKILPDGRHQFRLLNVDKPRIKNLSLLGDMEINTDRLLAENIFTVSIGTGEYNVFVKDASGKQTTIKITNEFGATITPVPAVEAWLLRINGGKKPYVVHLVDITNPNDIKTWKGSLHSDTLLITLEELQDRGLDKAYRVLVKNNERSAKPAEAGVVEGRSTDGDSTVLDAILFVLLLFIVLSAAYGVYLLVSHQKAKQRKATIYDSFH